jgi:RNA-binding protein NOB1
LKGWYEGDNPEDDENSESDSEGDEDDWITPDNVTEALPDDPTEDPDFVSCLTTDFAMQNVLLKMDLGRVGLEGRKINSIRKYVLSHG